MEPKRFPVQKDNAFTAAELDFIKKDIDIPESVRRNINVIAGKIEDGSVVDLIDIRHQLHAFNN